MGDNEKILEKIDFDFLQIFLQLNHYVKLLVDFVEGIFNILHCRF